MTPTAIAGYLLLFIAAAAGFVLAALVVGKLLRPHRPVEEKLAPYECGEPAVGSSFVQFDLRFYVVALVFIIFEVEIAFFFPWAVVFGTIEQLRQPAAHQSEGRPDATQSPDVNATALARPRNLTQPWAMSGWQADLHRLALAAMIDLMVFFGLLLVGFAYAWHRGDLNWVRAIGPPQ